MVEIRENKLSPIKRTIINSLFYTTIIIIAIIFFFHPIIFFNKTLQTGGLDGLGGEIVKGLWSYNGVRISLDQRPVIDPGSSAYNEELFPFLINRIVKDGQIPLWNPNQACGTPLAANPLSSTFYPPMWIACFKPGSVSWDIFLLFRLFLAGILMFGFLRCLNVNLAGCIVGAIGYTFSGYLTKYINLFNLNVDCLLPGLFWGLELIANGGVSYRKGLILTITLFTLMFLGGHPESLILAFGSGFIYLFIRLFTISYTRKIQGQPILKNVGASLAWYLFALFLGFLLSLFFIYPFIEFYILSKHTHKEIVGSISIPIYKTITLFCPYFYTSAYTMSIVFPMTTAGFVLTFLTIFAYPKLPGRRGVVLSLFLIIVFIYTKATGFSYINWIGKLPILNLIFYTKYQAVMYFAIAVLAGIGIDNLERKNFHPKTSFYGIVVYIILFFLLVLRNLQKMSNDVDIIKIREVFFLGFILGIIPLIILSIVASREKFKRLSKISIFLLVVSVILELYMYLPKHRADRVERLSTPPFVKTLEDKIKDDGEPWRIYGVDVAMIPNYSAAYDFYDPRHLSPLDYRPYWIFMKRFLDAPDLKSEKDPYFIEMFTGCQFPDVVFSKYLDLIGVKYLVSENYLNIPYFQEYLIKNSKISPVVTPTSGRHSQQENKVYRGYRHGYYYIGMLTPASLEIEIDVPEEGDTLIFDTFIDQKEYFKFDGGVRFSVFIECEGKKERYFHRVVNLKRNIKDFSFHLYQISLNPFAGKKIKILFQTEGDLFNKNSIVAIWRHLYLTSWERKIHSNFNLFYEKEALLYENKEALPRAFLSPNFELVEDEEKMIDKMLDRDWNPRKKTFVFKKDSELLPESLLSELKNVDSSTSVTQSFKVTSYRANSAIIEGNSSKSGILIFSDTYYPGWKVKVDGERENILRVNLFLRGVPLSAGKHIIEFHYSPLSFKLGLLISFLTVLLLIIGFNIKKKANDRKNNYNSLPDRT